MVVSKHQSSREFQTFMMPKLCDFCLLKAITIDICQTEPWVGTWNSLTSDSVCLEEHDFFYWWVQDVKQNNHFWFCLLRGTWLFLLMGSRCQTKNLQAVLTLDAISILTCKSAFCNNIALHCKGHTFQVVLDIRNNCWQSRMGRSLCKMQGDLPVLVQDAKLSTGQTGEWLLTVGLSYKLLAERKLCHAWETTAGRAVGEGHPASAGWPSHAVPTFAFQDRRLKNAKLATGQTGGWLLT